MTHSYVKAQKTGGDLDIFDIISLSHIPIFGWMLNWMYWTYRNIVFPADKLASEELALIFTDCPSRVVQCIKHSHFYDSSPSRGQGGKFIAIGLDFEMFHVWLIEFWTSSENIMRSNIMRNYLLYNCPFSHSFGTVGNLYVPLLCFYDNSYQCTFLLSVVLGDQRVEKDQL